MEPAPAPPAPPAPPAAAPAAGARVCYICLGGEEGGGRPSRLLHGGCACRGDAGFAHLSCLVKAARANAKLWWGCLTCKQHWTGPVNVGMCAPL